MSSRKTSSSPPRTRQGKLWLGLSAVLGASEAKLADFGLALYVGGNFFSEPPSAQFASAVMLTSSEAPLHAGIGRCSGKYMASAMEVCRSLPSATSPKANYSMPIAGTPRPGELSVFAVFLVAGIRSSPLFAGFLLLSWSSERSPTARCPPWSRAGSPRFSGVHSS